MLSAIQNRRSIRKFLDRPIPRETVEKVLLAAMEQGLERERLSPLLPGSAGHLSGAWNTFHIMAEAPVVILVINPLGLPLDRPLTPEERIYELCNTQSAGAAVENMSLAAQELGLGSLWICDICFAHRELTQWLDGPGELLCALALGYPGESPAPRPRKSLADIVEWRTHP